MIDISTESNIAIYERIREAVIEDATRPLNGDVEQHRSNIRLLLLNLDYISTQFNTPGDPSLPADALWQHCWQKIRYANIKAVEATAEIKRLNSRGVFDEFRIFSGPAWNVPPKPGATPIENELWGAQAKDLLNKQGRFQNLQWNAKRDKLAKIVNIARTLECFARTNPDRPILELFLGENFQDTDAQIWAAQDRLGAIVGDITALHIMMDIGLRCVKPDYVLTKAFYRLSWLPDDVIPPDMERGDLEILLRKGRARYQYAGTRVARRINEKYPEHIYSANRYKYTDKRVYRPVVAAGRRLSKSITSIFGNSIRELDWFIVKYGQIPEPERGIIRCLDDEYSIETFLTDGGGALEKRNTPLHYAAMHGQNLDAIRRHIAAGADVRAKNKQDQTPLDLARQEHHQDAQRMLEQAMQDRG